MNTKTKSLFGYIFPALGGLFVTYLYNVVDGIFVGQGVGSAALGAVISACPLLHLLLPQQPCFPWAAQPLSLSEWDGEIRKGPTTLL